MSGSEEFTAFVQAHSTTLFRTAYLLTGSRTGAEDLLQDTLTMLFPKWQRVQDADNPVAYVRRSLTNQFVSSTRRRGGNDLVLWELPDGWDGGDLSETVVNRELVWQLVGKLPNRQRAAVVLRYFHDLSDDDIGAHIGCRPGTVRSLISRGVATMRERSEIETRVADTARPEAC